MKRMKYNAIPKQEKSGTSKITPQEWNFIINVLKEQTNYNAETIEQMIKESTLTEQELLQKIKQVEQGLIDWDLIIKEIQSHKEIHIGKEEPSGLETVWFDLTNK